MTGIAAKKLKALRERSGWKVRALAKELGYGEAYSTYSSYESTYKKQFLPPELVRKLVVLLSGRGDPEITESEVLALGGLTDIFNQTEHQSRRTSGSDDPFTLPLNYVVVQSASVPAGLGGGGNGDDHRYGPPAMMPEHLIRNELRGRPEDFLVMEVEGQSMQPVFESGDQVLIDTRKKNPSPEGLFAFWDGRGIVVKWLEHIRDSNPPAFRAISENKRFAPYEVLEDEANIIGRIVWFARSL
jgi:phage repressor protein C with HTH and peptisase S24 domain